MKSWEGGREISAEFGGESCSFSKPTPRATELAQALSLPFLEENPTADVLSASLWAPED